VPVSLSGFRGARSGNVVYRDDADGLLHVGFCHKVSGERPIIQFCGRAHRWLHGFFQRRIAGRLKHFRQARDFIKESAHESIQLGDVGNALGMSPRGVEVFFRSSLGIGPNVFIRHQRLHGVRRALLAAESEAGAVKDLALQWGFWHMGHFSENYRTLFGESPTSTLTRRQG
jgi:AraC-like DNA-binding protein